MDWHEVELDAAKFASKAGEILKQYFLPHSSVVDHLDVQFKDNNNSDPVTLADTAIQEVLSKYISELYPEHGILGEEFDSINPKAEFVWVIDPIDGTRSFIAGHKDFGTLISLLHNNNPIIGIINCPAHSERWIGVKDQPSTLNNNIIKTSSVDKIEDSYLFTSGVYFDEPIKC